MCVCSANWQAEARAEGDCTKREQGLHSHSLPKSAKRISGGEERTDVPLGKKDRYGPGVKESEKKKTERVARFPLRTVAEEEKGGGREEPGNGRTIVGVRTATAAAAAAAGQK